MTRVIRIAALVMLAPLAAACAMLREGNPATTAGPSYGPCGSWVECRDTHPVTCCMPTTACAVDDGGPYCAADENYDPADPVTWSRAARRPRTIPGR